MTYRFTNLAGFAIMITMNSLANALPLNGKTTAELSDQYANLFVPAGITFSIWGVIYLLLLFVMIAQFRPAWSDDVESLGWFVGLNFVLNALWIVAWHYEWVGVSLIVMLAILVTLVIVNRRLKERRGWLLPLAFGVYLGWICLATIANVTALLVSLSWDGFGISPETWTLLMIGIGGLLGAVVIFRLRNPFIAFALVWGFYGIVLKRQDDYPAIAAASYASMAMLSVVGLYVGFVERTRVSDKRRGPALHE